MAVRSDAEDVGLVEYRLEDLARVSGVSARNIRAYRERGLLDSPRRVGRSAYYDERHLAQLTAITQLLAKGFNSAHIAEFFDSLRRGEDLADALGLQASAWQRRGTALSLDADDDDVRTLVVGGLARVVDGAVELTDPALAAFVGAAEDQRGCVRVMAHLVRLTGPAIDHLTESTAAVLAECQAGRSCAGMAELVPAVVSARARRAMRSGLAVAE
ncbi:hypothetical protein A5733_19350 [Mycobacterium sp. NS-7484]|nr:hypothetical protein A5733_19350 [Mycobacterium sp. NS-7484]